MEKHTIGELAYIDSIGFGLVPCKVLGISEDNKITVRVTTNRGKYKSYKRGDIEVSSGLWVIPRTSVFVRSGQYHIRNNYYWSK